MYVGIELEIPMIALGTGCAMRALAAVVLEEIKSIAPTVPDTNNGVWTIEGWYHLDGSYLEFSSRECRSPQELAYVVERAVRIVAAAIARVEQARNIKLFAQTGTCDYNGAGWGCHLNLSLPVDLDIGDLRPLLSLLVTIPVVAGTGGFEDPDGHEFVIAARMTGIVCDVLSNPKLAILHNRSEPLSSDANRLHLGCLSYAQSQKTRLLSIGVPAIGLLLIELGLAPNLSLSDPVDSLQAVIRDERCGTRLGLDGREMTALEIQRRWLIAAQEHVDLLPDWVTAVCVLWDEALTALENGDSAVVGWLEWRAKSHVYRAYCQTQGVPWSLMREMSTLTRLTSRIAPGTKLGSLLENPLVRSFVKSVLAPRGKALEDFESWIRCKQALLEADVRWSQVGAGSLFRSLEDAGILNHRIFSEAEIADSSTFNPSGRAAARAELIHRYARTGADVDMDWMTVRHGDLTQELSCVALDYDIDTLLDPAKGEE